MLKLMLNLHKPNNYAFFCPVSKVHLTVSSPVGFASEVTPAILKAVKAETVLDVDGVINLETGAVSDKPKAEKAPKEAAPAPKEEATPAPAESTESQEAEAPADTTVETPAENAEQSAEEPKTSKKGKRAAKETE